MEPLTTQAAQIRILAEFIEMPGLKLSHAQIRRLCNLSHEICEDALDSLVRSGPQSH